VNDGASTDFRFVFFSFSPFFGGFFFPSPSTATRQLTTGFAAISDNRQKDNAKDKHHFDGTDRIAPPPPLRFFFLLFSHGVFPFFFLSPPPARVEKVADLCRGTSSPGRKREAVGRSRTGSASYFSLLVTFFFWKMTSPLSTMAGGRGDVSPSKLDHPLSLVSPFLLSPEIFSFPPSFFFPSTGRERTAAAAEGRGDVAAS